MLVTKNTINQVKIVVNKEQHLINDLHLAQDSKALFCVFEVACQRLSDLRDDKEIFGFESLMLFTTNFPPTHLVYHPLKI